MLKYLASIIWLAQGFQSHKTSGAAKHRAVAEILRTPCPARRWKYNDPAVEPEHPADADLTMSSSVQQIIMELNMEDVSRKWVKSQEEQQQTTTNKSLKNKLKIKPRRAQLTELMWQEP